MRHWIVLAILAVMAALLIYAACCVEGDIDRQSEAHPPKPEKGRDREERLIKTFCDARAYYYAGVLFVCSGGQHD